MMHATAFTRPALLTGLLLASLPAGAEQTGKTPEEVIRRFYQAIADSQAETASALFSFALLQLDDPEQESAFRADLTEAFSEEFSTLARDYPKIELINIRPLTTLPEELVQYGKNCRSFHIDDNISQSQGGVEWSLCEEKDGWKIMFSLSTE